MKGKARGLEEMFAEFFGIFAANVVSHRGMVAYRTFVLM